MPGMSLTERTTAMRELQIKSIGNVVDRLRSEMGALDAPTEDVSALLLEYQRTLASLRQTLPTITTLARSADKTVDIERLGLGLELEAIQNMYDDGRLSRAAAKRLRDNVALMQVDLEDNV